MICARIIASFLLPGDAFIHITQITNNEHYYICLRPEDLDVRVEGNTIIITAKQEIQEVGGVRTRVFEQKFSLPSGVKAELVKSSLTRDGVLVITAPKKALAIK